MTEIKSKELTVNGSPADVTSFLTDINNLEKLMPADKIENWRSDESSCSFKIKGLTGIGMKRSDESGSDAVILKSEGNNPFDFTLKIAFKAVEDQTSVQIIFNGDMNSFTAMMVKKPLQNFFDMLVENLGKVDV